MLAVRAAVCAQRSKTRGIELTILMVRRARVGAARPRGRAVQQRELVRAWGARFARIGPYTKNTPRPYLPRAPKAQQETTPVDVLQTSPVQESPARKWRRPF